MKIFPQIIAACLLALGPAVLAGSPPYVQLVEQDGGGAALRVRIPQGAIDVGVDEEGRRLVRIAGLENTQQAGAPDLPVIVASLGLPESAALRVTHVVEDELSLRGAPPTAVRVPTAPGASTERPDPAIYRGDGVWPASPVVVERARVGELELARLSIYPVRFESSTGELHVARSLDIRIDFEGGEGFRSPRDPRSAIESRVVERHLLNAATVAQGWAAAPAPVAGPAGAPPSPPPLNNPGVKIRVDTEGLVRVTYAELVAIGFDPTNVVASNLQLSLRGASVSRRIVGGGDNTFDPGDSIEFYGVANEGRYSEENVYWLEEGAGPGLRFGIDSGTPGTAPLVTSFPHTEHYEEGNQIYTFGKPAEEGDPHFFWIWFEDHPSSSRVETFTHTARLPGQVFTSPLATMRAFFAGRTDPPADPDHRVQFSVNGTAVGETTWNGTTQHLGEMTFDVNLLSGGLDAFKLDYVSIASPDVYYLDWIEVEYPRETVAAGDALTIVGEGAAGRYEVTGFASVTDPLVLDVTDPMTPIELTGTQVSGAGPYTIGFEQSSLAGRRFHVVGDGGRLSSPGLTLDVPSDLKNPAHGADLLIVVPDGWEPSLAPLVAHRQAQGLRVVMGNLTDVADEFAGGNVDDLAIRDFVAYAYGNYQSPPPSYLLLVGEPNFDAKNDLMEPTHYHLMPIHFGVTFSQGETITDTWFGAVAGDDLLPEVAVGRISVRTAAAAADVVSKIIAYENGASALPDWTRTVLQVASDETQFEDALELAALQLPAHFSVVSEYRDDGAGSGSINDAIEDGAVLGSFIGHGNVTFWADSPGGPFYDDDDVDNLANAGRLPFVTALNCLNGLIGHPFTIDSLAEVFVNEPTNGAIAYWAPSAFGFLAQYEFLQEELYHVLFQQHVPQIGAATRAALIETWLTQPVSIDVVKELILLGDPAGWLAIDGDGDGALDVHELWQQSDPDDRDSDDDGLLDGLEGAVGADADGDGVPNVFDPDSDKDGLVDGLEAGVATPDLDTDLAAGHFRPDGDPLTVTDPFDPDTDDGGAPDGAEDRDADGAVTGGETDPLVGADDPLCTAGAPPEIAILPADQLRLALGGDDVLLTWGDASAADPCILYRVYVADGVDESNQDNFSLLGVAAGNSFTHTDGAAAPDGRYLIVGWSLAGGEGVWGHYGK